MAHLIINAVLFQLAWFGIVLLPAGWDIAAGVLVLCLHFAFVALPREWRFIVTVVCIGCLVDSLLALAGVIRFNVAYSLPLWHTTIAPLWLLLMWANFAATLCHSLRWLQQYKKIAALAGAIAAPSAYFGGAAISDKLIINDAIMMAGISATTWGLLLLLLPQLATMMILRRQTALQ